MILRTILLTIFNLLIYQLSILFAQQFAAIQGTIFGKSNNNPLVGTNIRILGTTLGTIADSSGYFYIQKIPQGKYDIEITRIGYQYKKLENIEIINNETKTINIFLKPEVIKLEQVKIEANRLWENYTSDVSLVGVRSFKPKQMKIIPGTFNDIIRAAQILSGVQSAGDFNSFLVIRGSSPDQSLVVMDGAIIPNPYRFRLALGGGQSIFDPNIIQDVHLHSGGYSSVYGNKLSSVLEVTTRNGNRDRINIQGSLNILDASGSIEGPIPGEKGSWILSARRTYFDLIAEKFMKSNSVLPYSYDINGKFVLDVTTNNRVSLRVMNNNEGTNLISELSESINLTEHSKTDLISLSWRSLVSKKIQFQTIFSYYNDSFSFKAYNTDISKKNKNWESLKSQNSNFAFRENIKLRLTDNNWLTTGFYWRSSDSKINFNSLERNFYYARYDVPTSIDYNRKENYIAGYIEDITKLNHSAQIKIGLRYSYSTLINESEISPRFNIWYKLNNSTFIEGTWGVCYQFPDPLSTFIRDQPVNFSNNLDIITAEKAIQNGIGIKRKLKKNIEMRLQLYHNDLDRLLLPIDEETYNAQNSGQGASTGIELFLTKKPSDSSRISGIISYAYGTSKYRSIYTKKWIPFKYDRQHGFTFWGDIRIFENIHASLLWRVASGLPYTPVLGARLSQAYRDNLKWNFIRGNRNSKRFNTYQRLDIRLSYKLKNFSLYLDLINIYNYKNIYDMTWEKTESEIEIGWIKKFYAKKRIIYMLPFLPSFGISFKF